MAQIELVMPQMGESITNGTITKWHKGPGDEVQLDEIILEISTDKVESEIPSPTNGRIVELIYEEGETVDVGLKICLIEDDPNVVIDLANPSSGGEEKKEEKQIEEVKVESDFSKEQKSLDSVRTFYTPLVKAMAKDLGVSMEELKSVQGTGAGGRVNKHDLLKYIEKKSSIGSAPIAKAPTFQKEERAGVSETRVIGERIEVIPMDNMRKAIAKNMVLSKQVSAHVNSLDEIDMTHLVKFREGFKHEFKKQEGFNLTYTHFILYALVQALKEFPLVNASVEGDNIIVKKDIHLGCAVAVPGNGLVVPNIRNADSLNMTGIARKVNELAAKAKSRKLTMDELTGGTFTFTNVGSFGTLMATPVILQPQVGIFASGVIKKRPIVTADDALAIRSMMYGTHTYDHRLVDGELGGLFLRAVKNNLENMNPETLF